MRPLHGLRSVISEGCLWGATVRSNMGSETSLDAAGNMRLRSASVMEAILGAFHVLEMQDFIVRGVTYVRKRDGRVRVTVTADVPKETFDRPLVRSIRIDIPRGVCPDGHRCTDVSAMRITPDPMYFDRFVWAPGTAQWGGWLHGHDCPGLISEIVLND